MNGITTLFFIEHNVNTDKYITIKRVSDYNGAIPRAGEVVCFNENTYYRVKAVWWIMLTDDTRGSICYIILDKKKEVP